MVWHANSALLAILATVVSVPACADILLKEIGSFHIGGHEAVLSGQPTKEVSFTAGMAPVKLDPNGQFEIEQMYVQYFKLAAPKFRYPLLMWHGGGLTGVTWETKPDGKPGWQMFFLNRGYDVYVSDAVERGRASWARYPEFFRSEPLFRSKNEAWELFRFGPTGSYDPNPANRRPFSDSQFPTEALDQFAKQGVPRWVTNDAPTQAAYDQLVERVGPCVIIVHSQGGNFGFNAALRAHDKIKALVALEPSGAPDPGKVDVAQLKTVPHLFVFGDHLQDFPSWQNFIKASQRYHAALTGAGVKSDWIDLPTLGIKGNSHMMMMDRNSDQIAEVVAKWLEQSRAD